MDLEGGGFGVLNHFRITVLVSYSFLAYSVSCFRLMVLIDGTKVEWPEIYTNQQVCEMESFDPSFDYSRLSTLSRRKFKHLNFGGANG